MTTTDRHAIHQDVINEVDYWYSKYEQGEIGQAEIVIRFYQEENQVTSIGRRPLPRTKTHSPRLTDKGTFT